MYAVIGIMALVTFVIEHADIRAIILTAVGVIIMMFLEFREGWEEWKKIKELYQ